MIPIANDQRHTVENGQPPTEQPLVIPTFIYRLNNYNTLQKFYHNETNGLQFDTINEDSLSHERNQHRHASIEAINDQSNRGSNENGTPLRLKNQCQQWRNDGQSYDKEVPKYQNLSILKSATHQKIAVKRDSDYPKQTRYISIIQRADSRPFLNQNYMVQPIKSPKRFLVMPEQSQQWSYRDAYQRNYDQQRIYDGLDRSNHRYKSQKIKRQEIRSRFQTCRNSLENERKMEELHIRLFGKEFQELMRNKDFQNFCNQQVSKRIAIAKKSQSHIRLKQQQRVSAIQNDSHIKQEEARADHSHMQTSNAVNQPIDEYVRPKFELNIVNPPLSDNSALGYDDNLQDPYFVMDEYLI